MITLQSIYDEIKYDFLEIPPINLVEAKINSVIHRINGVIGKRNEIIEANEVVFRNTWGLNTLMWQFNNIKWGISSSDWLYNPDDFSLNIPSYIDSIVKIWINSNLIQQISYTDLQNIDSDRFYFAMVGKMAFFNKNISSEISVFEIIGNYQDVNSDKEINMDDDFKTCLTSGAISLVSISQRYKDKDLYIVHSDIYERQLEKMRVLRNSSSSPDVLVTHGVDQTFTDLLTTENLEY